MICNTCIIEEKPPLDCVFALTNARVAPKHLDHSYISLIKHERNRKAKLNENEKIRQMKRDDALCDY